MDTSKFSRKPFEVDAVQVTEDNIVDIAQWCGGTVLDSFGNPYIKVDVKNALTPRQTKAFVGDWLLSSKSGFRVYTDNAFKGNFVNSSPSESALEELKNIFENPESLLKHDKESQVSEKDSISGKR